MKILCGLSDGAVLARDGDVCRTVFFADAAGKIRSDVGSVEKTGENEYLLTGIPVGGPFDLTLSDGDGSVCLRGLWVGDLWLLAGQSNMEGVGYFREIEDLAVPDPRIRQFSMDGVRWEDAEPRMHKLTVCPEPFLRPFVPYLPEPPVNERGVGPGYFFAKETFRLTGVPQGVIPSALGGSNMGQWNPDDHSEPRNLFHISIDRVKRCGGRVNGIFWYQGCAETSDGGCAGFTERMKRMIGAYRELLGDPLLPFVQVQISRFTNTPPEEDAHWSNIREQQRLLSSRIPALDTVSTCHFDFADGIHLSGRSQAALGAQAAESMYRLRFGADGKRCLPAPVLEKVWIERNMPDFGYTIAVRFGNLHGPLVSEGRPWGFSLSASKERIDRRLIFRVDLRGDTAYLRCDLNDEGARGLYLSYLFGNGVYANITDGEGRSVPAFGPLPLAGLFE